jgi:DNA invertase Pin-like site-specific DNA recombinase
MARVVGYVRVSTRKQVEGESLKEQEEEIRSWAAANGHEVVDVFGDEGKAGALEALDRPGLLAALEEIEQGNADLLAVRDLSRLARALHVQEAVLARTWRDQAGAWEVEPDREVLEDDPEDPMRTFLRQMQGAAHQLNSALARNRLQKSRRNKAAKGGYIGGKPRYGWRVEGKGRMAVLVPVPEEQAIRERMAAMRAGEGGRPTPYRAIADALNEQGIPAKNGGVWHHTAVRSVLVS